MSCSSAARRSGRSGSHRSTTAYVCRNTSLCRCTGSCSSCSADSSGRNSSERPVSTINASPAAGFAPRSSLSSSAWIRSADTMARRSRMSRDRAHDALRRRDPELGDEPRGAQHPQGVVGERHLRLERRVERLRGEVLHAAERIDERAVRQPHGHRVDREVPPREVGLDVLRERHRGLAMLLRVDLLAERRDLEEAAVLARAHRPEPHADVVAIVGPALQHPGRLVRLRRRRLAGAEARPNRFN